MSVVSVAEHSLRKVRLPDTSSHITQTDRTSARSVTRDSKQNRYLINCLFSCLHVARSLNSYLSTVHVSTYLHFYGNLSGAPTPAARCHSCSLSTQELHMCHMLPAVPLARVIKFFVL